MHFPPIIGLLCLRQGEVPGPFGQIGGQPTTPGGVEKLRKLLIGKLSDPSENGSSVHFV